MDYLPSTVSDHVLLEVIVGQFFERLLVVLVPYFKDSCLSSGLFREEKVIRLMVGWNTG